MGNKELLKNRYSSQQWWFIRTMKLKEVNKCEECGFQYELDVHHKHYKTFGKEDITNDLMVLCRRCHKDYHFFNWFKE